MADDTPTVKQAKATLIEAIRDVADHRIPDFEATPVIDALIAAVRAENISADDRELALNKMAACVMTVQLHRQTKKPADKAQALIYKNEARRLLRLPPDDDAR